MNSFKNIELPVEGVCGTMKSVEKTAGKKGGALLQLKLL